MPFKLDIGDPKTKRTVHIETNSDIFIGKKIGETINGSAIKEIPDLHDYEFVITGASDKAGFPALNIVEGMMRKRVLLTKGKGMRTKKPKGLRLRKLIRGNVIADDIVQINLKVSKQGAKSFDEIFGKKESKTESETKATEDKK
ncbi:MAG: 30S ribosomal protein S6e [Candidatus Pacearchaeota archaeon]|nr:30S ribosomal protein S6e [Candidatus Pacearchaeota archaeon]